MRCINGLMFFVKERNWLVFFFIYLLLTKKKKRA